MIPCYPMSILPVVNVSEVRALEKKVMQLEKTVGVAYFGGATWNLKPSVKR